MPNNNNEFNRFSTFGIEMLKDRYLMPGESIPDLFKRVAKAYSSSDEHCERIYSYMEKCWFMPATPILSNGGTDRGLPISCFLNETYDSLDSILALINENAYLGANGGGIGSYFSNVRSIGELINKSGASSGIVPFLKVMDSFVLAIRQGNLRRGSAAAYLDISHPEIEEFIDIRRPTGGDLNRRCLNLHHGVVIDDNFMNAVDQDLEWNLVSPKDNSIKHTVKARALWIKILTTRIETGEPYILFIDNVKKRAPETYKFFNLEQKTSNLCSEITLTTGKDHHDKDRTAVCCLSSLNLEYYDEWSSDKNIVYDVTLFLDNVLNDFIKRAPDSMSKAKYSAYRERSIGLGVMGFHSYLQKNMIPLESPLASAFNKNVFSFIKKEADIASKKIAIERGPCADSFEMICTKFQNELDLSSEEIKDEKLYNRYIEFISQNDKQDIKLEKIKKIVSEHGERFTHKMAIAPTASISEICGGCSPGIEPNITNAFNKKNLTGTASIRNKYLQQLLEKKNQNTELVWQEIVTHEGSVQHLDFLDSYEKAVFKTAYEINQISLINLAAERTEYICQAQSLNIFLPTTISKKGLHKIHYLAWKLGVKSLYYARSKSIGRGEKINNMSSKIEDYAKILENDECLSCQ